MTRYLVAVTACISGVAHTYMAAERFEKLCQQEKWSVKVETQGALGTENAITAEDIARANVAVLITDIVIDGAERFATCRSVQTTTRIFLLEPHKVMSVVEQAFNLPNGTHLKVS
ncbi:PTS fructose-like transporter subunit IIB [Sodalis sp. dw_23]|uniref:PTS fructose-like transporter subunit IIB n=1 Tax=Sodalis sp. RH16 TaxID=3394331 RepID=UPI00193FED50